MPASMRPPCRFWSVDYSALFECTHLDCDRYTDQGFISFPDPEPVQEEQPISAPFPQLFGDSPPVRFITIVSCITYNFTFGEGEPHQSGII
ncbi:hypothetical protein V1277_004734 [Bradyrhizobium sp. AZCC 1588]|uniref:hypothetical protein n=1 Tax=unclassified Bradyrhizobium TaxID=2631580 RepID=UPI002FEE9D97